MCWRKFIADRCELGDSHSAPFNEIVDEVNQWLTGRGHRQWSDIKISKRLKNAGFSRKGKGKKYHFILGLRLKSNPQTDERKGIKATGSKTEQNAPDNSYPKISRRGTRRLSVKRDDNKKEQ